MLSSWKNKKILILGFGKEGQETLQLLHTLFPEKKIGIADKNKKVKVQNLKHTKLYLGENYLKSLSKYDIIIKSPGVPVNNKLKKHVEKLTSATQIFFDCLDKSNTIIAVTGSKGKSTVTSLIYEILKQYHHPQKIEDTKGSDLKNLTKTRKMDISAKPVFLAGNIGTPLLSLVHKKNSFIICELSSYQLENLDFSPEIAIFTSFFPDHLDYHEGIENYFLAKTHITTGQNQKGIFLFHETHKNTLNDIPTKAKIYMAQSSDPIPKRIHLKGKHNTENIQIALKGADFLEIPREISEKAVSKFAGLPHRLEIVGEFSGITFVDDAISTTPESTMAAIETFSGKIDTIFLGGSDRGYDFSKLVKKIQEEKILNVVLFPDSGEKIKKIFLEQKSKTPCWIETKNMNDAVKFAFKKTKPGNICLLSTASPSYSTWKNFEEKGNEFQKWIKINSQ